MIISVSHDIVSVELNHEEQVLLHLSQPIPTPATAFDRRAYPRTAEGIAKATGIPYPSIIRHLERMAADGLLTHYKDGLYATRDTKRLSRVYVLTEDGKLLADAVRARFT